MNNTDVVKAYFSALDAKNLEQAAQYLSDDYQLVDFLSQPMDKDAMLGLIGLLFTALPNLKHSISNVRFEENVVKVTVQLSGTHDVHLDLRKMGIGIVPRSQKFIIFPSENYEFTIQNGKITTERNVSAISPSRRMSGMLRAFGVDTAAL